MNKENDSNINWIQNLFIIISIQGCPEHHECLWAITIIYRSPIWRNTISYSPKTPLEEKITLEDTFIFYENINEIVCINLVPIQLYIKNKRNMWHWNALITWTFPGATEDFCNLRSRKSERETRVPLFEACFPTLPLESSELVEWRVSSQKWQRKSMREGKKQFYEVKESKKDGVFYLRISREITEGWINRSLSKNPNWFLKFRDHYF